MDDDRIVQVGKHGPIFKLRSPHTRQSITHDSAHYAEFGRRGMCRVKHIWHKIGEPYVPEDDLHMATMSLIASSVFDTIQRCRCGALRMRGNRWT